LRARGLREESRESVGEQRVVRGFERCSDENSVLNFDLLWKGKGFLESGERRGVQQSEKLTNQLEKKIIVADIISDLLIKMNFNLNSRIQS
jgi:hypothetical protein